MQATSASPPRMADTGWLTTSSLVLMALFAVVVIFAILWGVRLSRQRSEARRIEDARVEAEGATDVEARSAPEPAPPVRLPVAPSPTPTDDAKVLATPPEPVRAEPTLVDEPIATPTPTDASPAGVGVAAPLPAGPSPADRPVTILKGLGPKVATRLGELGITTVGDLALLDSAEAESLDARLGPFTGRMARDRWLEQARLLASGDDKGFEGLFGRL